MKAILDIEKFNKECCEKMEKLVAEAVAKAEAQAKEERQQQKVQQILNPSKKRKF